MFVGGSAVGRAKQTRMITYHFLSGLKPIKTTFDDAPYNDELDEDMELPETKATFNPVANLTDATIKNFFWAKEKALPSCHS